MRRSVSRSRIRPTTHHAPRVANVVTNATARETSVDQWLLVYVAIGAFIGFFAGMLGMGGGGIQVPLTTMAFAAQGFPRAVIFVVFVLYMASSMLFSWKPKPTRQLPGTPGLLVAGTVIGVCSALAAMGGATLTIP